jgi:LmbE family N-acetylglucosaminyl deacetylase
LLWEADEPNHVEDARGGVEVKLAALLAHTSQYRSTMGVDVSGAEEAASSMADFRRRLERQLAAHGALAGLQSGEAFRALHDI